MVAPSIVHASPSTLKERMSQPVAGSIVALATYVFFVAPSSAVTV
jgi:hypothetical protein